MASHNKSRELLEPPNVKARAISSQAPNYRGRFNDHPFMGVHSSEWKRGTPEKVMIWSGLYGNIQQDRQAKVLNSTIISIPAKEVEYDSNTRACREISRKMATRQKNRMLGMDRRNNGQRLWDDKKAWDKKASFSPQIVISHTSRANTGRCFCVPCLRQSKMRKAESFIFRFGKRQSSGHEREISSFVWGEKFSDEINCRESQANTQIVCTGTVAREDWQNLRDCTKYGIQNIAWSKMEPYIRRISSGQEIAISAERNDYLGGFGIVHNSTDTAQARIIKWASTT